MEVDITEKIRWYLFPHTKKVSSYWAVWSRIVVNDFNAKDPKITYPQSASFVKFLIENYGLTKFKKLWVVKKNLKEEFQRIYQREFSDVEKEWLKKCRA